MLFGIKISFLGLVFYDSFPVFHGIRNHIVHAMGSSAAGFYPCLYGMAGIQCALSCASVIERGCQGQSRQNVLMFDDQVP